ATSRRCCAASSRTSTSSTPALTSVCRPTSTGCGRRATSRRARSRRRCGRGRWPRRCCRPAAGRRSRRGRRWSGRGARQGAAGASEKLCEDYPTCAWAHNSAAWLAACCRRNLDKALAHAEKAVKLAPDTAGHLDTLAEVHFQLGHKDKAVELQKKVIKMEPNK